jgi:hypothetical protein
MDGGLQLGVMLLLLLLVVLLLLFEVGVLLLALASRCLVLMCKVAICHPSTYCYYTSGTLFPSSGGRPALPVPSPAAISLLSLL